MAASTLVSIAAAQAEPVEVARESAPTAVAQAPVRTFTASASIPNGIVVKGHGGHIVSLTTRGKEAVNRSVPSNTPVVFSRLTAGRQYEIWIDGQAPLAVVPVSKVKGASGLVVTAAGDPGSVLLSWKHQRTTATGGNGITYAVTATSPTAPAVRTAVTSATTARLTGLKTNALYTFTVTPKNTASSGRATSAVMTSTLADLVGTAKATTDPTPGGSATPPATPAITSAATSSDTGESGGGNSGSGGSSRPATRTIYVCPTGYNDTGTACETTTAYTFHAETLTQAYTYHQEVVRTETFPSTCTWTEVVQHPLGDGGSWTEYVSHDYACTGTRNVMGDVKDAVPDGYTDNGSAWTKDVQVMDATPSGYRDNGSAWVKSADKIAQVVPA